MEQWNPDANDYLSHLIVGAAFLGSGGGGPLPLAQKLASFMRDNRLIPRLISFDQASATGHVGMVAGIGSPANALNLEDPFTNAPERVVRAMEKAYGSAFDYLIPGETGPMNSLIPMLAAAQLGVPLIDGDGAGRAMSTLSMSTFNAVAATAPYLLGNESSIKAQEVMANLSVSTPDQADRLTRSMVGSRAFGTGAFSTWPSTIGTLRKAAVPGSVSLAIRVGEQLNACQINQQNPIKPLQSVLGDRMTLLFTGQVKSVTLQTAGGFDSAVITLQSSGEPDFILYALNENMIAWRADKAQPVCIGPDSLCYVTTTGESLTNATIQNYVGSTDRLHVVGLRAAPALHTPGVLAAYAQVLSHLGYPGPYRPLTQENVA